MRTPETNDFVNKTIENVDIVLNAIKIKFTDGTEVSLCAEQAIYTDFGTIPGIFVEDK